MDSRKKLVEKLLDTYRGDGAVLGIIQVGSTAKGYDDKYSDVDLVLVVTEDKYAMLEKNFKKSFTLKSTSEIHNDRNASQHQEFQK